MAATATVALVVGFAALARDTNQADALSMAEPTSDHSEAIADLAREYDRLPNLLEKPDLLKWP